jgi:hypothetical protein
MGMKGYLLGKGATNSPKKQRMSSTIYTVDKGCSVHLGINQGFLLKSSVRLCGPIYIYVLFVERTSSGPPTYVHTSNRSIYPQTLAYVHSLGLGFKLWFSRKNFGNCFGPF